MNAKQMIVSMVVAIPLVSRRDGMNALSALGLFTLIMLMLLAPAAANAKDVSVDCNNRKKDNSIQAALDALDKQGPHTITVSGTCVEYVTINGFDRLNLLANPGASINDPAPAAPEGTVLRIIYSRLVVVDGFTINGGGPNGIGCFAFAACHLLNNTVQGAADFAVFIGRHSSAELFNNTIQNSAGGLQVTFGGDAVMFGGTIQGITSTTDPEDPGFLGYPAVDVSQHAYLRIGRGGLPSPLIQNNTFDGVRVSGNSTFVLLNQGVTITSNGGSGIVLNHGSVLEMLGGHIITDNGGNGVWVGESSFAFIPPETTLSGNAEPQVECAGTFSNVKGDFVCSNP